MVKTFATVLLTAILTSAFWIFAIGISRSPQATNARVNGKSDEGTVKVGGAAALAVADNVEVGPTGLAIPVAKVKASQLQDTFTAARAGGARRPAAGERRGSVQVPPSPAAARG